MRTTLLTGAALVVAAVLVVTLGASLGLGLESSALMGAATGAVVALVPDRGPVARVLAFLIGFVAAWLGFVLRAAVLPDATSGRAVAAAVVVIVCVAAVAGSRERLPLWGTLLGAAALAGSYELTYADAPAQVLDSSLSTSTTVLLTCAIGFLAAATVAPRPAAGDPGPNRRTPSAPPFDAQSDAQFDAQFDAQSDAQSEDRSEDRSGSEAGTLDQILGAS